MKETNDVQLGSTIVYIQRMNKDIHNGGAIVAVGVGGEGDPVVFCCISFCFY